MNDDIYAASHADEDETESQKSLSRASGPDDQAMPQEGQTVHELMDPDEVCDPQTSGCPSRTEQGKVNGL